jgi:adenylate cyclase
MSATRRLAAILAVDVAGYSWLIGEDEEGTLDRFKALRREIIDPKIAEHHGRIVKTTGDGLLVEFTSVVDALRCATQWQDAMRKRGAGISDDNRIEFRIGVHQGDIVVENEDIFGDGVNIAARLEGLAEPGGICVSARVQEDVAGRLDLTFDDLGEQSLKNIARPVRVYRVGLTTAENTPKGMPTESGPALALPDKPSIAVLPFANMSGDPEQEYFADGMVEEIITALSRIRWLFVIARNSSFTYKGQSVDVKQVGRELGVRYILEGSVRKAGQRVRITGQLIDAITGMHLWADRFDGSMEDVFDLQDKVAISVAGIIEPALQAAETARAAHRPTSDLTAYDLYLQPLSWAYHPAPKSRRQAVCSNRRSSATRTTGLRSLWPRSSILGPLAMAGAKTRRPTLVGARISHGGQCKSPATIPSLLRMRPTRSPVLGKMSEPWRRWSIMRWRSIRALLAGGISTAVSGSGRANRTLLSSMPRLRCA